MRKLVLVLLLLPCFNDVIAQAYCPFDKDAKWCYSYYLVQIFNVPSNSFYSESNVTSFGDDTIINGKTYTEVICPACNLWTWGFGSAPYRSFLRDDTLAKKVYWLETFGNTNVIVDTLLFDFSLTVGDTLPEITGYGNNIADGIVKKDTTIFIHGKMRRVLTYASGYDFAGSPKIIEGFGFNYGYNFNGENCGPDNVVEFTSYDIDTNDIVVGPIGCYYNAYDVLGFQVSTFYEPFNTKYCVGDTIQFWLNPPDKTLIECDTNYVLSQFGMTKFNDTLDIVIDTFLSGFNSFNGPFRYFEKKVKLTNCGCLGIDYDLNVGLRDELPRLFYDTVLCINETVAIAGIVPSPFDTIYGTGFLNPDQFSGALAGPGRHTIYFVADSFYCNNQLDSITFNVLSASSLVSFSDTIVCLDDTITASYNLPSAGDSIVGPGVVNNTQIITSNAGFGIHTVLVYTNANNCNIVDSFQYEVLGPFTTIWMGLDSLCSNEPAFTVSANPVGGVFTGLTNNMTGLFDPQITGVGTHLITYQYQSNSGCNVIDSSVVVVYDTTNTTFQLPFDSICSYELPVTLIGSPTGGVFSGQGVVGNQFNPAMVSNLNMPIAIQYSFTNANGCSIDAIDSITVNLDTTFSAYFVNDSLCRGETGELKVFGNGMVWIDSTEQYTLIDSFLVNYSYNDIFNTPVKQVVFQDLNGCFDTLIVTAYIDKTTNPFANGELTICYLDSTEITLTGTNNIT